MELGLVTIYSDYDNVFLLSNSTQNSNSLSTSRSSGNTQFTMLFLKKIKHI